MKNFIKINRALAAKKNFIKINRALAAKKRFLSFLAMSAVVLGMAFTFNACGGNNPEEPGNPSNPEEPKRFKMTIIKKSDTSVKVEIESPSKDLYCTFGCVESETFLKDPRGYIQSILDTYKETNEPTYPEGLHIEAERTYDGLDANTEYVIYVCEVNEEYKAVGNVEYTRIKRGEEVTTEDPQEPQVDPEIPVLENGVLPGKFTVDENGTQVRFSKGNLQATTADHGTNWTWGFAEHQWVYIGDDAANNSITGNKTVSSNGTVDLFGWSTDATYYGINKSEEKSDYSGNFKDWGETIGEGWRTLSKTEWVYLFLWRDKADELFGFGSVNGINGIIILPDDWILPEGATFNSAKDKSIVWQSDNYYYNVEKNFFSHNTYTVKQWETMEKAGAVFLPAAGSRAGTSMDAVSAYGYYWSSTPRGENAAYDVAFCEGYLTPQNDDYRFYGQSVRLVR